MGKHACVACAASVVSAHNPPVSGGLCRSQCYSARTHMSSATLKPDRATSACRDRDRWLRCASACMAGDTIDRDQWLSLAASCLPAKSGTPTRVHDHVVRDGSALDALRAGSALDASDHTV